ncbi:hypothetical protein SLEP1_g16881 [Rubroshorea leprosula]|uniref:Uncharacterized protein n=1 Tax=Rubroshorea leprosula TaxID=152421 RepID=A0AAV5IY61_9ROSI|nr:hypothetical protein SLEP1_g16881 [Rubroshorea leprosula]
MGILSWKEHQSISLSLINYLGRRMVLMIFYSFVVQSCWASTMSGR